MDETVIVAAVAWLGGVLIGFAAAWDRVVYVLSVPPRLSLTALSINKCRQMEAGTSPRPELTPLTLNP